MSRTTIAHEVLKHRQPSEKGASGRISNRFCAGRYAFSRLEKIQSLLKSTELPLKEIAAAFNYADIYTFSRQFKRYVGQPPGEFRRSH